MPAIQVEDFLKAREEQVIRIKEFKEQGGKVVGAYCAFCPRELILAAGAIPVDLCGTSNEPIPAAEITLPRNLCPLIKSLYGFAVTDTCPYLYFSNFVVGETTCDGKKKMFELLNRLKPVHVMQLPYQIDNKDAFELWTAEIRTLRKRLERELQVEISDGDIWKAIDLVNRETASLKAFCDLNRADPPPLNGLELIAVLWVKGFSVDRESSIKMVDRLATTIVQGKKAAASSMDNHSFCSHNRATKAYRPRILLTGCPVSLGSEKVVRLIEELGGAVVAMENCSVYKTLPLQTELAFDDPVKALAQKYIQTPCSCMSPNPYRIELLECMIKDFLVQGIVDLTWQACHTYNIEAVEVQELARFKKIPYLHLETDYSTVDLDVLKVRLEALLEMLQG